MTPIETTTHFGTARAHTPPPVPPSHVPPPPNEAPPPVPEIEKPPA